MTTDTSTCHYCTSLPVPGLGGVLGGHHSGLGSLETWAYLPAIVLPTCHHHLRSALPSTCRSAGSPCGLPALFAAGSFWVCLQILVHMPSSAWNYLRVPLQTAPCRNTRKIFSGTYVDSGSATCRADCCLIAAWVACTWVLPLESPAAYRFRFCGCRL